MKRIFLLTFILLAILAGCKKDKGGGSGYTPEPHPDSIPQPPNYKGMGTSNEDPEGPVFNFPEGIIVNKLRFSDTCTAENWRNRRGAGAGVQFCISLTNTTNQPRTVRLPPCIIFISTNLAKQNGVLLTRAEYIVPANTTETFMLEAFCLNKWRKATTWGDEFRMGPKTDNAELAKLADMLKGREQLIEMTGYEDNNAFSHITENRLVVAKAVWEITDGSGKLTEEHKQKVLALK